MVLNLPGTIDNDLNARSTRNVRRPETFPISIKSDDCEPIAFSITCE